MACRDWLEFSYSVYDTFRPWEGLPDDVEPTDRDIDRLTTACAALVDLRFPESRDWARMARTLTAEGWRVELRLMWVAEARKGLEFEQAPGRTNEEALAQLRQLTQMDDAVGVP